MYASTIHMTFPKKPSRRRLTSVVFDPFVWGQQCVKIDLEVLMQDEKTCSLSAVTGPLRFL
jgi:hypothetical protein